MTDKIQRVYSLYDGRASESSADTFEASTLEILSFFDTDKDALEEARKHWGKHDWGLWSYRVVKQPGHDEIVDERFVGNNRSGGGCHD